MKRGFKSFAENQAINIRKELGLKPNDFLCAFKLCDHLLIPVMDIYNLGLDDHHLKNLDGEGTKFWSAATIPIGQGKHVIVHNKRHSEARQQSNLMHEISHILCEHETEDVERIGNLSGLMRSFNKDQEEEAEWLGSSLQLPREALLWALKNNLKIEEICEKFNASKEMVKYRINITAVNSQLKYSKRFS